MGANCSGDRETPQETAAEPETARTRRRKEKVAKIEQEIEERPRDIDQWKADLERADEEDDLPTTESQRLKALKETFKKFDSDGDQHIDETELEQVIRDLYKPSKAEVRHFVRAFDQNKDNEITFEEFKAGLLRHGHPLAKSNQEEKLRDLFDKFDEDHSGRITGRELIQLARQFVPIDKTIIKKAMFLFDKDMDQRISFEEFASTIERLNGDLTILWQAERRNARVARKQRNRGRAAAEGDGEAEAS